MNRKVWKLLIIGSGVLTVLLLVVALLSGGLPDTAKKMAKREIEFSQKESAKLKEATLSLQKSVEGNAEYLQPIAKREEWIGKMQAFEKSYAGEMSKFQSAAEKILKENREKDAILLYQLISQHRAMRIKTINEVAAITKKAERALYYKTNYQDLMKRAQEDFKYIEAYDLLPVKLQINKAQLDWPLKKMDLASRFAAMNEYKNQAREFWNFIQKSDQQKPKPYEMIGNYADRLEEYKKNIDIATRELSQLVSQLYYSLSVMLTDMRTSGSQYEHQYQIIKIFSDNTSKTENNWVKIDRVQYDKNRNQLGMTIKSKAIGLYDFEASQYASPPGYNYVGDQRYGQWQRDSSGNSFWAFYGQYAFMRNLFWGSQYYSPIYRSDYRTYESYRSSGRTYYGRTATGSPKYGTTGTHTRTKYSSSSYMTTRYAKSSSSSSSGYKSYRGSSYSGSRSGGRSGK